jgi:hypothetical protein
MPNSEKRCRRTQNDGIQLSWEENTISANDKLKKLSDDYKTSENDFYYFFKR